MADEADIADRFQELSLKASLAARTNIPREVSPVGKCYNCEEEIPQVEVEQEVDGVKTKVLVHTRPFCDEFCRDDYKKRNKRP